MGVDIENYRQKIGNFQPSCKKHKIKSGINRKQLNFFLNQFMKSKRKEINGCTCYRVINENGSKRELLMTYITNMSKFVYDLDI